LRNRDRSRWANGVPRVAPRAMNSTTPVVSDSVPATTSTISRPSQIVSRDHWVIEARSTAARVAGSWVSIR